MSQQRRERPRRLLDYEPVGTTLVALSVLEHGHKRIGFLAPSRQIPNVAPKYAGYEEAMSGSGSAASGPIETASDFGIEAGYESALRLLTGDDPPTAIVAATDNHAIATMQAANELGIGIPDDLALIGNDDIFLADVLRPALSSVNVPVAEMGQRAITLLQDMIAGQPAPTEPIRLTPSLVTRRSCGCHPDA